MAGLRSVIRWLFLGLGLLLVIVVVGAALYTRTRDFDERIRRQSVDAINRIIRGSISVERIEGTIWRKLTLHDVILRFEGNEILHVPRLSVSYSLFSLLLGPLTVGRIEVERPRAVLLQDEENRWNIVEALTPREPTTEVDSGFALLVQSLRLADGDLSVRLAGAGEKDYRFTRLNFDGRIDLPPAGPHVEVHEISASLAAQGQPDLNLKGALEYHAPTATLRLKNFWAASARSRARLSGELAHGDTMRVKARSVVEKLSAADMVAFIEGWPIRHDLEGVLDVAGTLGDLGGEIKLAAAGAGLTGKFTADLSADEPRYSVNLAFRGFDLPRWLDNPAVAGIASGSIQARGVGFEPARSTAKGQVSIHGAALEGWTLGAVSMAGRLENGVAAVDGRLAGELGGADWSGKVVLKEKKPSYEMALSVKDLDVKKTLPDQQALEGRINFQAQVVGAGLSLAEADTRVEMRMLPSSLGPVKIKEGALSASVKEKKLRVARGTLNTADAALEVSGELGLDPGSKGRLDYKLQVGDLSPWLVLAERRGSGSMQVKGSLQGNLAEAQTEGMARFAAVRVEDMAVHEGGLSFALRGARDWDFPRGTLSARLTDIEAGLSLRRLDLRAELSPEPTASIKLDLSALDSHERRHSLAGDLGFTADAMRLRLERLTLTAPDGVWRLVRPATVTRQQDVVSIEQLGMRNGGELLLEGRFALRGAQDLTLDIQRLPLASLSPWLPEEPKITGLLTMRAQVTGTAAQPQLAASARLSDSTIAGQTYEGAVAGVDYRDGRAAVKLAVQQDATHYLNGSGVLPLALSWHDGWRAEFADGMELRAQSDGLSLVFLNAFGGKNAEKIAGELTLDVVARGSIKQPDLRGTFSLRDGGLKAIPLGVDIRQIAAAGVLDSRTLTVRELSARAKEGSIHGSGMLALDHPQNGAVKLSLKAKRWPAVETQRYQVRIDGGVDVQGSLTAPRIKGEVVIQDGSLRPDLAVLEQSKVPLQRDETIVIAKHRKDAPIEKPAPKPPPGPEVELLKNASVDLTVRAPGNLWIKHPDIVSELSGNIRATKSPGREIDLTGRIDVVRGWASFQGRRFQVERGRIEFTGGGKIDPSLDLVAVHRLPQYQVQVIVGGTAEKPSLKLASQPQLEQADILSLLIFGKPIRALNQNEQGSLQESALQVTTGYFAGQIASSVSQALGLESLGVDIRQVGLSGGRVGFGSYVGDRTFFSVSQELAGERGREVSMEYQFAQDWKIGTSTNTAGSNGIDLIWQKRY